MSTRICKIASLLLIVFSFAARAQTGRVSFVSPDKNLQRAFDRAKNMALHYRGNATDPVGPWYEAALPSRNAFCMRDVSHQCIGAEILGLSAENYNMTSLFARNISASKDWCSYWEINKWGRPAPEDYRNDREFWYNLPANFDILYASWRLYLWTGDKRYISNAAFVNFQQKTVKEYIDQWVLAADSLLTRPVHPNKAIPVNEKDAFSTCRGLPSYSEGIPKLKTGIDLVAGVYRGLLTYSDILATKGLKKEAAYYAGKADAYRRDIENDWWDTQASQYNTQYGDNGKFAKDQSETFLLWFDVLQDTARLKKTVTHMVTFDTNIESISYNPYLFYKNGLWDDARKCILYLTDPATPRREYPEVSFSVVEGIVHGLMGISPDARSGSISTMFRMSGNGSAAIKHLPILHTNIDLSHLNCRRSVVSNRGRQAFKWKAIFYGNYGKAYTNGVLSPVRKGADESGNKISYVVNTVKPGITVDVRVEK